MSVHRSQPVQLPTSRSVEIDSSEAVRITIHSRGEEIAIFINREEVALDFLTEALLEKSGTPTWGKVQVFGDRSVSYQNLFQVLDRIKAAGINDISLAAEEK